MVTNWSVPTMFEARDRDLIDAHGNHYHVWIDGTGLWASDHLLGGLQGRKTAARGLTIIEMARWLNDRECRLA